LTDKVKPDDARKLNNAKLFELIGKQYKLGKMDFVSFEEEVRKLINKKTQMRIPDSLRFNFGVVLLTFLIRVKQIFVDGSGYVDLEKFLGIKKDKRGSGKQK